MPQATNQATKNLPPELERAVNGKTVCRDGSISVSRSDDGKEIVELSFASDQYIEDWPGFFIRLSHEQGDYDFSRLNNSGPLLLEHSRRDQIGVIDSSYVASVDGGKRSRAKVRFSKSKLGQEIKQDVDDEIRTKCSNRFEVLELTLDKESDGDSYYTAKWRALEVFDRFNTC